jgi:hypothetical protein
MLPLRKLLRSLLMQKSRILLLATTMQMQTRRIVPRSDRWPLRRLMLQQERLQLQQ